MVLKQLILNLDIVVLFVGILMKGIFPKHGKLIAPPATNLEEEFAHAVDNANDPVSHNNRGTAPYIALKTLWIDFFSSSGM
jgi:hypothetical protein